MGSADSYDFVWAAFERLARSAGGVVWAGLVWSGVVVFTGFFFVAIGLVQESAHRRSRREVSSECVMVKTSVVWRDYGWCYTVI